MKGVCFNTGGHSTDVSPMLAVRLSSKKLRNMHRHASAARRHGMLNAMMPAVSGEM